MCLIEKVSQVQSKKKEAFIGPQKPGAPSIVMKFSIIPEVITECLKVHEFKVQEKDATRQLQIFQGHS